MPKRDLKYMNMQRDQIAGAAYQCILEKGIHNTSLRDVCMAAGVSMGALYIHFTNKDELIDAAVLHHNEHVEKHEPLTHWAEFEDYILTEYQKILSDEMIKILSLTFQLHSERVKDPSKSPLMHDTYTESLDWMKTSLQLMHENKDISLPLGLDITAKSVASILLGATTTITVIPIPNAEKFLKNILLSIGKIVGRK